MVDWTAALSGVATAVQITKDLRALGQSMDEAASKAQLVTLMEQLSEVRMQLLDAREEARQKDEEIARLTKVETDVGSKLFQNGFFFDTFDDGAPKGDPYCPYCIERKEGLYRLHKVEKPGRPWHCPHCKTEYRTAPSYSWEKSTS
jgi:uncharacterized Zn-finger protein